jgi:mannose-6-phosphate isomerase-like protein (cupin superfamily)
MFVLLSHLEHIFSFGPFGDEPLAAIGVTMPPWPGDGEAYEVEGKWK